MSGIHLQHIGAQLSQALFDPNAIPPSYLEEPLLGKLLGDLARKMFTSEEIARRYDLTMDQIRDLLRRPEVFRRVRAMKAAWDCDEAAKERLRLMARLNIAEAMPHYGAMMTDKTTPANTKVDLLKAMTRLGDVDATGVGKDGQGGPVTAPVSISFHFAGANRTEKFTTVVDHQPEPAPEQISE